MDYKLIQCDFRVILADLMVISSDFRGLFGCHGNCRSFKRILYEFWIDLMLALTEFRVI